MKLTKRSGIGVVAGVSAVLLLAGCSGNSGSTGPATAAAKPSGSIQLSYWGSSSRVTKYDQIDKLFEQQYPGTTVQAAAGDFSTYFDKLNVQAASKSMPCVTTLQTRSLNDYTSNSTLMDLDSLVKSGQINVSDIPKSVLDTGDGPDGKLYMIPFGVAWNAIAVNTAMEKQYGITPLKAGYTQADYTAWLKDASSKLPKGVAATDNQGQDEPTFSAYVIANGYKMFNSKGKIGFPMSVLEDYWNMWQGFQKAGYTNSPSANADEPTQLEQFYVTENKLLSEQVAGNAIAGIQAADPSADMTTMTFATGKAGLGNMFFVSGYSIPKSCNNVTAAAAYINFWTNNDKAASVFASDNGAVANSTQLKQQIATPSSPGVKTELQQYQYILDQKVPTQTIPAGYDAVFEEAFTRDFQNVEFGKQTVKQATDAFFSEANASLGKK
ncbi:ABC transporter substrate-binding protein [Gryllotalpicola reticulitermitis]|uniref:ABC transporter substrate-binding protein n=1 Tax=Gryllotalpicola reticulitermitis TaxID=1184153 RepID=A0ABV8QEG7_9MICO